VQRCLHRGDPAHRHPRHARELGGAWRMLGRQSLQQRRGPGVPQLRDLFCEAWPDTVDSLETALHDELIELLSERANDLRAAAVRAGLPGIRARQRQQQRDLVERAGDQPGILHELQLLRSLR
jgi:hypothetical protein